MEQRKAGGHASERTERPCRRISGGQFSQLLSVIFWHFEFMCSLISAMLLSSFWLNFILFFIKMFYLGPLFVLAKLITFNKIYFFA